jgi:hypothetical protein
MKTIYTTIALLLMGTVHAQEPDTTRIMVGGKEVIIISPGAVEVNIEDGDTLDASPDEEEQRDIEAHWAGLEFGPTMLLNEAMKSSFPNDPQWDNDPGKSFSWNLNLLEHKFPIYRNHIGITTGLGINWTRVDLKQYVLNSNADSLWATVDTVSNFDKNKLRAIYLTAPLMVEFCTNGDGDDDGFYLAAGVIGGVRIGSSVKTKIETENRDVKDKTRGTYALNAFRLDAAVKLGYDDWGVFANYNVLPLFDTDKTAAVYPLTFGLTYNF